MKHIHFEDRSSIQELLTKGSTFSQIATAIGKDRATISREVKNRRTFQKAKDGNVCVHRDTCRFPQDCHTRGCLKAYRCRSACGLCRVACDRFEEERCRKLERPPYVCNGCGKRACRLARWTYRAKEAQQHYEQLLRESREGISLSEEELRFLERKIVPLVKQGVSVAVACDTYADSMPVSEKTMYRYIDQGVFGINNLDLRQKVRRPLRKKSGPTLKVDKKCYQGRNYKDHLEFMEAHPDLPVCQMDTVEGKKGGKVLLTLLFTNCNFQLMYLRERNTSASVTEVFQQLRDLLKEAFPTLFPVILTDRGSEFSNPQAMEYDIRTGRRQCRVFYCDPMNSNQKSECERNHEIIRYVLPKGTCLDPYTQGDIQKASDHVNSYPRRKWNGLSPVELFDQFYGPELRKKLGTVFIPTEELCLNPSLLKK